MQILYVDLEICSLIHSRFYISRYRNLLIYIKVVLLEFVVIGSINYINKKKKKKIQITVYRIDDK
jgi:hypothetical protein